MIVSVKGAELFCSTRGAGPACLVLTGIGAGPYERQTPPPITDHLRLVYVELRGSGRSTGNPADLSFDVLADDLEAVRLRLGVERIAVLGHSILGVLAIEYARRRPQSVSHVIAVGTPPSGDMAKVTANATAFFEADATEERRDLFRDNVTRLPENASMGQQMFARTPMRFFDPRFDAAPLFAEANVKMPFFAHLMGTLTASWDVRVGASSLRARLLIAHGRYDYVVPYLLWQDVASELPDATFQLFERSGHQPFFEEPERFAGVVIDWMSGRLGVPCPPCPSAP
jgi:proline iminopeptidase